MTNWEKEVREVLHEFWHNAAKESSGYFDSAAFDTALTAIREANKKYVVGEEEKFTNIPVLDHTGSVERVIKGDSYTPLMVARNTLREEQRKSMENNDET